MTWIIAIAIIVIAVVSFFLGSNPKKVKKGAEIRPYGGSLSSFDPMPVLAMARGSSVRRREVYNKPYPGFLRVFRSIH